MRKKSKAGTKQEKSEPVVNEEPNDTTDETDKLLTRLAIQRKLLEHFIDPEVLRTIKSSDNGSPKVIHKNPSTNN